MDVSSSEAWQMTAFGAQLTSMAWLVALVAALIAIIGLVLAHRRQRSAWRAQAQVADAAGGSLDDVCNRLSSPGVGSASMLADNVDAWVARWRLINEAKHSIDFSTFILGGDAFGMSLLGALLRKQEAGVRVRVLVDSFGLRYGSKVPLGRSPLRVLRAAGVDVRIYNVLSWRHLSILAKRRSLMPLFACDHDKLLLVDNDAAICGGRNVSPDYFAHPDDDELAFSDRDVLLRGGDSVANFRRAFERERRSIATVAVRSRPQNEALRRVMLAAADGMDHWLSAPPLSTTELAQAPASTPEHAGLVERTLEALSPSLPAVIGSGARQVEEAQRYTELAAALAQQPHLRGALHRPVPAQNAADMNVLHASSAVHGEDHRINDALLQLLAAAKHTVLIESPYLILAERALLALEAAAHRGVRITIVTNGPTSTDNAPAEAFFLRTWPRILARVPTLRVFVLNGTHNAHGKTAVIDGRVAIVGSYNLDIISAAVNGEVAVVLRGQETVEAVAAPILARLAQGAPHVVEYTIDRQQLASGNVVEAFGPADHVPWRKRMAMQLLARVVALLSYVPGIARP